MTYGIPTVIYFALFLARSVCHGTIKLNLAAVHILHICCGHGDPLQGKLLLPKVSGVSFAARNNFTSYANLTHTVFRWLFILIYKVSWALRISLCSCFYLNIYGFLRCSEFTYQGVNLFRSQFDLSKQIRETSLGGVILP